MAAPKNPNREAAARGGKNSSRKGVPNKASQAVTQRLAELGCDPLELSAKIAKGEDLDGPHPQLKQFRLNLGKLDEALEDAAIPDKAREAASAIRDLVETYLTRGYVPIELRSKHITDLMQYTHPKRKAIEMTAELTDKRAPSVDPTKLTDETLNQLLAARAGETIEGEIMEDDEA